jgi:copper chaperone CopZ
MTDGLSVFDLPDLSAGAEIEAVITELEKADGSEIKTPNEVRVDAPVKKVTSDLDGADVVRVNLPVPKVTRTAWRAEALRRDIGLAELIRQAMKHYANV